jgi:hypothetical protein
MSELLEDIGREFKGLLIVVFYGALFSLVVAVIAWLSRALGPRWEDVGRLGFRFLHSEYLPHILAVSGTVLASILFNWWLVSRQQRGLRALLGVIYETFYGSIRPEDKTIYRVSCYRYYDSDLYRFWRRHFCFTKKKRTRRPLPGTPFLECIARHGHEGRKSVRMPTTLTMAVSPENAWSEGFAGLVAREQRNLIKRTSDINGAAVKIKKKDRTVDLASLREGLWEEVKESEHSREDEVAWRAVEESCNIESLTEDEKNLVSKFVKETNTTPYLLLGVRGGKTHCNNFFGFPVFKRDSLWGVVTIDALDDGFEAKMAQRVKDLIGVVEPSGASGSGAFFSMTGSVEHWIDEQLKLFAKVLDDFVQA